MANAKKCDNCESYYDDNGHLARKFYVRSSEVKLKVVIKRGYTDSPADICPICAKLMVLKAWGIKEAVDETRTPKV